MPRYKYKCLNCGNRFEEYAKNSYEKVPCPKCKSKNVSNKYPSSVTAPAPSNCG